MEILIGIGEFKINIVAIIQARMGSKRLPKKILASINGKPMIYWILKRIKKSKFTNKVVIATTKLPEDDKFCDWIHKNTNVQIFRGSENDVLNRYYECAKFYSANLIVRITADDPFKEFKIIDKAIKIILDNEKIDYCSNTIIPSYPEGLDIEVFNYSTLKLANLNAKLPSEREHVTPYITNNPNLFNLYNFKYKKNLSKWRWTVDKPKDLKFARVVYKNFIDNPLVDYEKIINYLTNNPEILHINSGTIRMEGYLKSIAEENNEQR